MRPSKAEGQPARAGWVDSTRLARAVRRLILADWLALTVAAAYATLMTGLLARRHAAFNTHALDLGKFDQAIWNTAQGRWFEISLGETSVLHSHFSPALALYAPLYGLWPDIRLLFGLLSVFIAGAAGLIYLHLRSRSPWLGLAVLAAFLMHPLVHQVHLANFRRESLAIVAGSAAIYCLLNRRHLTLVAMLAICVLCKEDLGFLAGGIGLHLLASRQAPRLGAALSIASALYLVVIPYGFLPGWTGGTTYGFQEQVFGYLGGSPIEIAVTAITQPQLGLAQVLQPDRLRALWTLTAPTLFAFVLRLDLAVFMAPFLGYLLLSNNEMMGRLDGWYPSVIMVLLFWATGLGLARLPGAVQHLAGLCLVFAGLSGWWFHSPLWPGARWHPELFQVSGHDRAAAEALVAIPNDAVVAAQDGYVPHLAHRPRIYLIPFEPADAPIDFVVVDEGAGRYPFATVGDHLAYQFRWLTDPSAAIVRQVDRLFIFSLREHARPETPRADRWPGAMALTGYTLTVSGPATGFLDTSRTRQHSARLELYWRVEAAMRVNYSEFVHLIDATGAILAQSDGWPADGYAPTAVQLPGAEFRSVRYLLWDGPPASDLQLRIGLYDAETGDRIQLSEGRDHLVLPVRP